MFCLSNDNESFNNGLTPITLTDIENDIAYQILVNNFGEDLAAIKIDNTKKIIKLKKTKKYLFELEQAFQLQLLNRSQIVRELYLLHQTARALERFNNEVLNLTYPKFRFLVYFPNVAFILVRMLPDARKFLQVLIRKVYQEFTNKATGLVSVHVNSFYLDQDIIKHNILEDFLGNALKKNNPLELGDIKSYYKACFRNIFQFYFRRKRNFEDQSLVSFNYFDSNLTQSTVSSRIAIYRDVFYQLQLKKTQKKHNVLGQLSYNYQIFRSIIVSNEFQNIYQNTKKTDSLSTDKEYQLMNFFDDDIFSKNTELFEKIRKLPLIYKLLRCVHIQTANTLPYNDFLIKPDNVKFVIVEELSASFKNMFIDTYVSDILEQVAKNFIKNILSGEYINLITFSSVKINHISFLDQLRKFIRICLDQQN